MVKEFAMFLESLPFGQILLALSVVALITFLFVAVFRAHRDPESDLNIYDLVMEPGRDGKIHLDPAKVVIMGSWIVATWVLVTMRLEKQDVSAFFIQYTTVFVAPLLLRTLGRLWASKGKPEEEPLPPG